MSEGMQMVLWIAGVHLIGFIAVAVLLLPAMRDEPGGPGFRSDEGDDGWGRGPRKPETPTPKRPRGGIPLPDAVQASVRLRGPGRLSELRPAHQRRPSREPARRPARTPHHGHR